MAEVQDALKGGKRKPVGAAKPKPAKKKPAPKRKTRR
jgi:hypothetical protein